MARKPDHFKKSGPALGASTKAKLGDERTVVRTQAGTTPPPVVKPGTPRSAFDIPGRPLPQAPGKRPRLTVDLTTVKVHKGLPIPPRNAGVAGQSKYAEIWAQLGPGDCAELPDRQAHGMASWCKKQQHAHTLRRLTPTTKGIWRQA